MQVNLIYSDTKYDGNFHLDTLKRLLDPNPSYLDIKFNFIKDSDVTDIKEKYCLIYPLQGHYLLTLNRGENLLSNVIVDKIKRGYDITIYFCTEAECEFEHCYDEINKWSSNLGIYNSKIYSISGNSKLENIETYGIKTIKNFNPIIHRICGTMNAQKHKDNVEYNINRKYIFQCYNNMPKEHRLLLLSLLHKENLLEFVDWSLMRPYDKLKELKLGIDSLNNIVSSNTIKDIEDSYKKILNGGETKYSEYENDSMRNPNAQGEPDHNMTYLANPHQHAYVNIVNESQYELSNTIHITEKSIIPFHFNQLPLFVATNGHVKKLKELYNFDVFDDIIDHSYDSIQNNEDRMFAILKEIKRLKSSKDLIVNFIKNNKDRFDKNREIVYNLSQIDSYRVVIDEFLK